MSEPVLSGAQWNSVPNPSRVIFLYADVKPM